MTYLGFQTGAEKNNGGFLLISLSASLFEGLHFGDYPDITKVISFIIITAEILWAEQEIHSNCGFSKSVENRF